MWIRPWDHLSPSRRGFALGSLVGLAFSAFYLFHTLEGSQVFGYHYFFSIAMIPAIPGAFVAEQFLNLLRTQILSLPWSGVRILYIFGCAAMNYAFWGLYGAWLFKIGQSQGPRQISIVLISLINLFFSMVGLSYSVNRGFALQAVSPVVWILLLSFGWALVSLAILLSWFGVHLETPKG